MAYKDLNAEQRVTAVAMDIMKHQEFCRLGGLVNIGLNMVDDRMPTAATDGVRKIFGRAFTMSLNRKQMRYLMAHECLHVALHHCTEYVNLSKQNHRIANKAMDYVVNQLIEEMDPGLTFVERPTKPAPLIDPKYQGWSVVQVFRDLMQQQQGKPQKPEDGQPGGPNDDGSEPGDGDGEPMDTHIMQEPKDGETTDEANERKAAGEKLKRDIEDAIRQGQRAYEALAKLRGEGGGGAVLENAAVKRNTDWRTPLRRFVVATCQGDDMARWSPPNRVLRAAGITLPSTYSETVGELGVFCDTSGSMHHLYPILFGELERLCQQVRPAKVRVLWWSDDVEAEQVFEPKDYPNLTKLIKPKGCGGTTVSCVARYVRERRYKFQASVYISDGYIESQYELVPGPILFAVLDNESFVPLRGQVLRLYSDAL